MTQPNLITVTFAAEQSESLVYPILVDPVSGENPAKATWNYGFPAVTMQPYAAGGIPPMGQDMNGVLRAITDHIKFLCGGGFYKFSNQWVSQVGGYEQDALILSDDGQTIYRSRVSNNQVNPNTAEEPVLSDAWDVISSISEISEFTREQLLPQADQAGWRDALGVLAAGSGNNQARNNGQNDTRFVRPEVTDNLPAQGLFGLGYAGTGTPQVASLEDEDSMGRTMFYHASSINDTNFTGTGTRLNMKLFGQARFQVAFNRNGTTGIQYRYQAANGLPFSDAVTVWDSEKLNPEDFARVGGNSNGFLSFTRNTGKSLSSLNNTNGSDDNFKLSTNYNLRILNSNNAMIFAMGGVANNRAALIQVGHQSSQFNQVGVLNLNPFGGSVNTGDDLVVGGSISETSDATLKQDENAIPEALLDAWPDVRQVMFRWKHAVEEKGEDAARRHFGWMAQDVERIMAQHGLSIDDYALVCKEPVYEEQETGEFEEVEEPEYETVSDQYTEIEIINGQPIQVEKQRDKEIELFDHIPLISENGDPVVDENGDPILHPVPRMKKTQVPVVKQVVVDHRYTLRYTQCLVVEAEYLRREIERLKSAIS